MVDSPTEDELREGPLPVDMNDLSEGPIILDTMVWTSKPEPQAEPELCPYHLLHASLDQTERRECIH